jgi:hypothetical protein
MTMYQGINIKRCQILPTDYVCVFYMNLRRNNYTAVIGFCNQDRLCLLRGTNEIFK